MNSPSSPNTNPHLTTTPKHPPTLESRVQSIGSHTVYGVEVGPETRCAHYDTDRDVVAFKFACCERYYPCFRCHEESTSHEAVPWPRGRFDEPSVLCGVCGTEFTVPDYRAADYSCPACDAPFNPGCANHAELYFETHDSDPE